MRSTLATLLILSVACGGDDDPAPPEWQSELPSAATSMEVRRGLSPARGIIHFHSPYSHDACDGEPREDETGPIDEDCLATMRAGLCKNRMDFGVLTEHDDSMADEDFTTLFSLRGADTLILDGDDNPIASRLVCDDGHELVLYTGGENDLMPIMIDRHPEGTIEERHAYYNADDAAAMAAFREHGGLAFIPHTEQRPIELLRELDPDGIEIYQLHSNIDPGIRVDHLGLSPDGAIRAVAEYADTNPGGPEPDLALISFLEPADNALEKWDQLLGDGRRVVGSGATDAHQNAFPILMSDGERGDSYRRMMRWFSNVVLVADTTDAIAIKAAVASGRMFVAFEVFGTPAGFDAVATGAVSSPVELGGEVAVADGATLEVTLPTVYALDASLPLPEISGRILHIDSSGGRNEVASGAGPTLSASLDQIGAYRVEVTIIPHHLGPYLGRLGPADADRVHPWIYANPIYVTP